MWIEKDIDKKIKELYLNGSSSNEVADKLNIKSHSTIQRHLRKMGVPLRSIKESVKLKYINGHKSWCKGLTKENNEIIRERGIKTSISKKGKKIMPFTEEHKRKIGIANSNRIWKEESKQKSRIARLGKINKEQSIRMKLKNPMRLPEIIKKISGSNSHNWQGGKSFEPYNKQFNNIFKRAIRKRDNQICMMCGIHRERLNEVLHIHHINYDKKLSIPENCISLCKSCHWKTNYNRVHWTNFFQSLLIEKYAYKYLDKDIIIDINKLGVGNEK